MFVSGKNKLNKHEGRIVSFSPLHYSSIISSTAILHHPNNKSRNGTQRF